MKLSFLYSWIIAFSSLFPISTSCLTDETIGTLLFSYTTEIPGLAEYQDNFIQYVMYLSDTRQKQDATQTHMREYWTKEELGNLSLAENTTPDNSAHANQLTTSDQQRSVYQCPEKQPQGWQHSGPTLTIGPTDHSLDERRARCNQMIAHHMQHRLKHWHTINEIGTYNKLDLLKYAFGRDFSCYTEEQLHEFLTEHAVALLENHGLYPAASYQRLLHQYVPGYQAYIEELYDKISDSWSTLKKVTPSWIQPDAFKDLVYRIQQELRIHPTAERQRKLDQEAQERLNKLRQQHKQDTQTAIKLLSQYYLLASGDDVYDEGEPSSEYKRYKERSESLVASYISKTGQLTKSTYRLPKEAQACINKHHLENDFAQYTGSAMQQTLHKELISVLNHAGFLLKEHGDQAYPWTSLVALSADTASFYNTQAHLQQAVSWTDTCWLLLNYAQAAVEGFFEGITNTACFAIASTLVPRAVNLTATAAVAAGSFYIAREAFFVVTDAYDAYTKSPHAFTAYIDTCIHSCKKNLHDIQQYLCKLEKEKIVKFSAETMSTVCFSRATCKAAEALYKTALKEAKAFRKKIGSKGAKAFITDFLYKHFDPSPHPGILNCGPFVSGRNKVAQQVAYAEGKRKAEYGVHTQIMKHPELKTILDSSTIRSFRKHDILIKDFKNGVKQKSIYVMPASMDKEMRDAIHCCNGRLNLNHSRTRKFVKNSIDQELTHISLNEENFSHVIGVELNFSHKDGWWTSGGHYDTKDLLERIEFMRIVNPQPDPITKIIRSKACLMSTPVEKAKNKTFFPKNWTIKDILTNAQEALDNAIIDPELAKNGFVLESKTNTNMKIRFILDTLGNLISFYPV